MTTEMKEPEKTSITKNLKIEEWDDAEDLRPNILRGIYAYGFAISHPLYGVL